MLPFFHSFGFTGTLWLPLLHGFGVVYHPNPMDAKTIGELAEKYKVTHADQHADVLRRRTCGSARPSSSRSLRYAIVGAEKLREPLARDFKEKFGVALLEGYGCTEMAPVVAVNVPDVRTAGQQTARKPAPSAIRCPASSRKVVDPETGDGRSIGSARVCCS